MTVAAGFRDDPAPEALARRAVEGDASALDALVRALKDDVYDLAMRMLGHPDDAEDAAQEILVRVVTNLASFRGEARFRTWVWRIATNHLMRVRRGRRELESLDFEAFDAMLAAGLAAGPGGPPDDPERAVLEEEVKLGCTSMMLACLDREHRLAFILGEIFDLSGPEAAEILAIEPAAYRQRLSRARRRLRAFMTRTCGLVDDDAPCRCTRQIGPSIATGLLDPAHPVFAVHPRRAAADPRVLRQYRAIESVHRTTRVLRDHPGYAAPDRLVARLRAMIADSPD